MARGNNILVPTDFSSNSGIVLEHATYIAKVIDADITLLHVVEKYASNTSIDHSEYESNNFNETVAKAVNKQFDSLLQKYQSSEIVFNRKIASGKVHKTITEVADEINARLIIMANDSTSGIQRFLGTNALRVIKTAKCPVISMKNFTGTFEYKNVLLPLDLNKETREKVRIAIETARQFKSTIHVVSVTTTNDEFIVNKLKRQLKAVKEQVQAAGVAFTAKLIEAGTVAKTILEYGDEVKADAIFIMIQQEIDFLDMVIGTSAQKVINQSEIPVITIRPMERRDTTFSKVGAA